jgi:hypothetical protein
MPKKVITISENIKFSLFSYNNNNNNGGLSPGWRPKISYEVMGKAGDFGISL